MKVPATEELTFEAELGLWKAFELAENNILHEESGMFCHHSSHERAASNFFRYSILPAISLFGMLECMIIEGSYNTDLFITFIEDLLQKMRPFPEPKSVIVMDNCAIHKDPKIRELILGR